MSVQLVPKFDRVIIRRDGLTKKDSPIIVSSHREAPPTGIVLSIGPTCGTYRNGKLIETIKVGSRVVFGLHAGTDLSSYLDETPGSVWLVVDSDILCVIEEKE